MSEQLNNEPLLDVPEHTTHYACDERLKEFGGQTVGCCYTGHECGRPRAAHPTPNTADELDTLVRDLTKVHPLPKSEVRRRLLAWRDSYTNDRVAAVLKNVQHKIGGEEEPDFDPGDATYGDTDHDHNAVVYGRNEAKGEAQGIIETELGKHIKQDTAE